MKYSRVRFFTEICIVLLLSLFSVQPLLTDAYFPMHDDTQVGRVVAMGKALRWGQFPVRWVSDLGYGYGYPLFNFYGPLPYYTGGLLYALGVNGLVSTKIMMIIGMVAAAVSMFFLVRHLLGFLPAIVAAVFYLYAPYHAVQLYVRGAIGELYTLIFYPLIMYSFLVRKNRIVGAIGIAGVVLSHTLLGYATVLLLTLGLALYWIIKTIKKEFNVSHITYHVAQIIIGLGLSAFFWLPAIAEMRATNVQAQIGATADYRDHFVCLSQLWSSPAGFGGSLKGCNDGLSFMTGKLHVIVGFFAVLWLLWNKKSNDSHRVIRVGLGIAGIGILLLTNISMPLWLLLPKFGYIQYPWRFLMYVSVGLSLVAGGMVSIINNKNVRVFIAGLLLAGAFILYPKWFQPQYLYTKAADTFESENELKFRVSAISDEYMTSDFVSPQHESGVVRDTISQTDGLTVAKTVETDVYSRYDLTSVDEKNIEVRKLYFPGIQIVVNGREVKPLVVNGIPSVNIPKGNSVMEIHFRNTPVRTVANAISIGTIIWLFFFYGKTTKKIFA